MAALHFTRAPHATFVVAPNEPPRTQYKDVELAVAVGGHPAGARFPIVHVNWRTAAMRLYLDIEDAINDVPCEVIGNALPPGQLLHATEYAAEVSDYLVRGHSLSHAGCQCQHSLSDERASELGVTCSSARSGLCPLPTDPVRRTSAEVACEIGVYDISAFRALRNESVIRLLRDKWSRCVRVMGADAAFETTLHTATVTNRAQLLEQVNNARSTYKVQKDAYLGMANDIDSLVSQGLVYFLKGAGPSSEDLLYPRDPSFDTPVDSDIRELWHTTPSK